MFFVIIIFQNKYKHVSICLIFDITYIVNNICVTFISRIPRISHISIKYLVESC
jgi:hypothetical protein